MITSRSTNDAKLPEIIGSYSVPANVSVEHLKRVSCCSHVWFFLSFLLLPWSVRTVLMADTCELIGFLIVFAFVVDIRLHVRL